MKAMFAVLLILSTGLWAVAQETASNANGKPGTTTEVINPAVTGSGKTNYVPLWLSATKLGTSKVYQTGGDIGIGTTTPTATLDVNGAINAATSFNLGGNLFAFGSYTNQNAFLGFAGNTTMTGIANAAVGFAALFSNTTGSDNTATGFAALYSNTTGGSNTTSGYFTLNANTTGYGNTASGVEALSFNTTGYSNTATGGEALFSNTTGNENTAVGVSALASNTTGSDLTCVGYECTADPDGLTNATAIGAHAVVGQSNSLVLGGTGEYGVRVGIGTTNPSNVLTIGRGAGYPVSDSWETYSSRRWKTNIQTLHGALGKVERLRGVSYDLKDSGKHEIGVVAEEVGAVVPEVVSYEKNGKDAQAVDYGRLTALLIEAVKQQQREISALRRQLQRRAAKEAMLESRLERLEQDRGQTQLASARPVR